MAEGKYVVFKLEDELFGLPIETVERILPDQKVTPLPKTPPMFLGVFDLRGETVPALDLRLRFDRPTDETEGNFVVVLSDQGRCAVRVDGVQGIVTLHDEQIDENPAMFRDGDDPFVAGVGKQGDNLVVLLDVAHLVPHYAAPAVEYQLAA